MKKIILGIISLSIIFSLILLSFNAEANVTKTPDGVHCTNGCDVYPGGWGKVTVCDSGTTNCITVAAGTRILNKIP